MPVQPSSNRISCPYFPPFPGIQWTRSIFGVFAAGRPKAYNWILCQIDINVNMNLVHRFREAAGRIDVELFLTASITVLAGY